MYKPPSDYERLNQKVQEEIAQRQGDPKFSLESIGIDALLEEQELTGYNHETKVYVAAQNGMTYHRCEGYEQLVRTPEGRVIRVPMHKSPRYRVNGVFDKVSEALAKYLEAEHSHQENSTMCDGCAESMRKDWPMLKELMKEAA